MTSRTIGTAVAGILVFLLYALAVPALLSADSMACILLGMLLLALPLVRAVIYFIELYKETHDEQQ